MLPLSLMDGDYLARAMHQIMLHPAGCLEPIAVIRPAIDIRHLFYKCEVSSNQKMECRDEYRYQTATSKIPRGGW